MVLASLINIKDGSNAMRLVKGLWKKLPQLGIEPQTSQSSLMYTARVVLPCCSLIPGRPLIHVPAIITIAYTVAPQVPTNLEGL